MASEKTGKHRCINQVQPLKLIVVSKQQRPCAYSVGCIVFALARRLTVVPGTVTEGDM